MKFEQLNLSSELLQAVSEAGYTEPTPIQEQAIPPVLAGKDVLGCAQTGTGKTAAFALPILQRLGAPREKQTSKRPIRTLILTPTRELALQIQENFEQYSCHTNLCSTVIFGGVSQGPQITALKRGVDILIATPGRLWDLMGQKFISLSAVECFVLDEADRMLDMGFFPDVKRVIRELPKTRQTLLFSATMPKEIQSLADSLLTNPIHVSVTPVSSTVDTIQQCVYMVNRCNKRALLASVLQEKGCQQTLVFTRTKHGADRVARDLNRTGISAAAIHGDKSQGARQRALSDFKSNKICVLVATDIAARGIDINGLPYVINFDLPEIPETYVHRIGRTGRAGMEGTAISFCDEAQTSYLIDIEELTGRRIEEVENHAYPMTDDPTPAAPPTPAHRHERRPQKNTPHAHNRKNTTTNSKKSTSASSAASIHSTTATSKDDTTIAQPKVHRSKRRKPANAPHANAESNPTHSHKTTIQSDVHKEENATSTNRVTASVKKAPTSSRRHTQHSPTVEKHNALPSEKAQPTRSSTKRVAGSSVQDVTPRTHNRRRNASQGNRGGGRRMMDNSSAQVETRPLPAREISQSLRARIASKVADALNHKKNNK